jgi:hypothetical protein
MERTMTIRHLCVFIATVLEIAFLQTEATAQTYQTWEPPDGSAVSTEA